MTYNQKLSYFRSPSPGSLLCYIERKEFQIFDTQNMKKVIQETGGVMNYKYKEIK